MANKKKPTPDLKRKDVRKAITQLLRVAVQWERGHKARDARNARDVALFLKNFTDSMRTFGESEALIQNGKDVVIRNDLRETIPRWEALKTLVARFRKRPPANATETAQAEQDRFAELCVTTLDEHHWPMDAETRARVREVAKFALSALRGSKVLPKGFKTSEQITDKLLNAAGHIGRAAILGKKKNASKASENREIPFQAEDNIVAYIYACLGVYPVKMKMVKPTYAAQIDMLAGSYSSKANRPADRPQEPQEPQEPPAPKPAASKKSGRTGVGAAPKRKSTP